MNCSFKDPKDDFKDGDVITSGNFTQAVPDTPIMVGLKLTIKDGNFVNVRKDPNWVIEGGNWMQVDRCTNLMPELIQAGVAACGPGCRHKTGEDQIVVDGKVVDVIRYYEDIVLL
jgi:hypothetical protein